MASHSETLTIQTSRDLRLLGLPPEILLFQALERETQHRKITNLVLFATGSQAGFHKVVYNRFFSLLISILVRYVIEFTLQGLSSCVLSFSGDFADTFGIFQNCSQFIRSGNRGV